MARRKQKTPGSQPGRALSPVQREEVHQLFLLTGNKSEVARRMKLSEGAVRKCLKEIANDPDPEMNAARRKARLELAEQVRAKARMAIGSVTEDDFDGGRIIHRDAEGNITRVIDYGPSLMQKVTAGAILIDKVKVLDDIDRAMTEATEGNRLLMPDDVDGLIRGIQSKMKSLTILRADFAEEHKDLTKRAEEKIIEAEFEVAKAPEIISLDDLDGN